MPRALKLADAAPGFTLPDQTGREVSLSAHRGRKLLVFFYPKAGTPGCTTQACSVQENVTKLLDLGAAAVGISPDPVDKQAAFAAANGLEFPLLADTDHSVAESYGVWGERWMAGRKYMGVERSSFLIDEQGKILEAWYKVSPGDTVPNALKALKATG